MTTRPPDVTASEPAAAARPPPRPPADAERIAEMDLSLRLHDAVVASLAHDFRGPLFAISLNASLLDRLRASPDDAVDERRRHALLEIQRAVSQASVIVAKVLEVDALCDGQLTRDIHHHHTVDLLESAARVVEPLARARVVRVATRVHDGAARIECDRAQLLHALVALLGFAVRRAPRASRVELTATRVDRAIHLTVVDEGLPLDPADDPATPPPLHRARRVVELHGGTLRVGSGSTGGTTLEATLPAEAPRP